MTIAFIFRFLLSVSGRIAMGNELSQRIRTAAGHDLIDVAMRRKILPPCVQDRYDSGNSAKLVFVFDQINDCLGRTGKQSAQKELFIQLNQRIQIMRNSQNNMAIWNSGNAPVFPLDDPCLPGSPSAARAIPAVVRKRNAVGYRNSDKRTHT